MAKKPITTYDLRRLMRNQPNPRLRYEPVFYRFLFGSNSTIELFKILIDALAHPKLKDGSTYKSADELARDTGYSSRTVERARKSLVEAGFKIWVKKNAEGTPTNHYRFEIERFQAFVAQKLNVSVDQVKDWMLSPSEKQGD